MKILSGRQPWWFAIIHWNKRIENRRTWSSTYRGPVLLHAAAGCTDEEMRSALEWMTATGVVARSEWAVGPLLDMPRGGVVGRARIVDLIPKRTFESLGVAIAQRHGADLRWWDRDQNGFVLADVEPLPFIPWKGSLGLRDAPPDLLAKIGSAA